MLNFLRKKKVSLQNRTLYCRGLKIFSTASLKIIIFLVLTLLISCTSSPGSGSDRNAASKPISKSSFTQEEMELFYSNVAVKKIIRGNRVFLPVTNNKKPVFVACPSNDNDYIEFFVLFAENTSENNVSGISIETVSDLRNIYMENISPRQFLLAIYRYYESSEEKRFIHEQSIGLETRGAFSSLKEIVIDKNNKIHGISANFVTEEGVHEDIVVKRKSGYSITGIKNTISDSTRKEDLDNNGVIDLIRYEKVFVDGFGVETFITLYKFNGEKFIPEKTVNTVKDLRTFINEARLHLEAKRVDLFVNKVVAPDVLRRFNLSEIISGRILQRIFYPVKRESAHLVDINTMLSSSDNISFIFPEIFENPFRVDSNGVYSFTTYVRVLLRNGNTAISSDNVLVNEEIYIVKIYMADNPFDERKFFFFVN